MKIEILIVGQGNEELRFTGETIRSMLTLHNPNNGPILLIDERYPEQNPDQELISKAPIVIRVREG